jgi:hypothetical protein
LTFNQAYAILNASYQKQRKKQKTMNLAQELQQVPDQTPQGEIQAAPEALTDPNGLALAANGVHEAIRQTYNDGDSVIFEIPDGQEVRGHIIAETRPREFSDLHEILPHGKVKEKVKLSSYTVDEQNMTLSRRAADR